MDREEKLFDCTAIAEDGGEYAFKFFDWPTVSELSPILGGDDEEGWGEDLDEAWGWDCFEPLFNWATIPLTDDPDNEGERLLDVDCDWLGEDLWEATGGEVDDDCPVNESITRLCCSSAAAVDMPYREEGAPEAIADVDVDSSDMLLPQTILLSY